jgi:hypothetical protein
LVARVSAISDRVRDPVNRQITMIEASPSMTDPNAPPSTEMDPDAPPAIRPSVPSPFIPTRDAHDSNRAALVAACQRWSFSSNVPADRVRVPAREPAQRFRCSPTWHGGRHVRMREPEG